MPERGPNNKDLAERLGRQGRYVTNVRDDAEAAALLAARGYKPAKIAEGLGLLARALKAYGGRDGASATLKGSGETLAAADDDARDLMGGLRNTLRGLYSDEPEHLTRLGVATDDPAGDRDTFLTESRATLAAVREKPYAAEAAEAGQDAEAVDAAAAAVEALATAAGQQDSAVGGRKGSTKARDKAYADFQKWMARFRRFARIAFKDHPDVAAHVGL